MSDKQRDDDLIARGRELASPLTVPARAKCVKCGHNVGIYKDGSCMWSQLVTRLSGSRCICKCEFPTAQGEAEVPAAPLTCPTLRGWISGPATTGLAALLEMGIKVGPVSHDPQMPNVNTWNACEVSGAAFELLHERWGEFIWGLDATPVSVSEQAQRAAEKIVEKCLAYFSSDQALATTARIAAIIESEYRTKE